jgi:Protein of unknown function (DUF3826)
MFLRFLTIVILLHGASTAPLLHAAESNSLPSAVQVQRAEKIVASLQLTDPAKAERVRDVIAQQYYDLNIIHTRRDSTIAHAKANNSTDKMLGEAAINTARADAETAQNSLHPEFLARLATELNPTQIDQVKDGLTYGVLPLTYRVYQEMLPNLSAEQRAQILAWLTEAREHAMDGSTSEEKHAWFGKYKGRINNYLSKAGIDMKQAEKEMTQRKKSGVTK